MSLNLKGGSERTVLRCMEITLFVDHNFLSHHHNTHKLKHRCCKGANRGLLCPEFLVTNCVVSVLVASFVTKINFPLFFQLYVIMHCLWRWAHKIMSVTKTSVTASVFWQKVTTIRPHGTVTCNHFFSKNCQFGGLPENAITEAGATSTTNQQPMTDLFR